MDIEVRGDGDDLLQVRDAMAAYSSAHPAAEITIRRSYRWHASVRVVNPAFAGQGYYERLAQVEPYLKTLPDDVASGVARIVVVTPDELVDSPHNRRFEEEEQLAPTH